MSNTLKAENEEKDENFDRSKGEEHYDNKQDAVLPSKTKEKMILDRDVLLELMRKQIPVNYRNKKLQLQFLSVSEYLQAFMTP